MTQIAKDAHLGLQDRVVLVTGASRGIGETIAKLFGAYGARVVVNYFRGEEDAERIVGEIVDAGGTALKAQADVSDSASVARLLELTVNTFGPVEILVNNAVGDYEAALFQELTWSDVQRDLDIILKGAFNCCQAVLPSMVDHGFGRIVNLSTVAVENPPAHHARYVIAKSALLGLTRSLAVEYAAHGICVNAVMPGLVETDLTSNLSHLVRDMMQKATPMQRHASPLDVARAVVFLGSDWAGYTTGQQIAVTGGQPPFH
jgi:3-oxoacyl-[acyl-carrier protein] reductase